MAHCTVKRCCFIVDLRWATFSTAVFSVLGNIGVLAVTSWSVNDLHEELAYNDRVFYAVLSLEVLQLLASIVAILMDVMLFFGALLHRREFLNCWLWGCAIISGVDFFYIWNVSVAYFGRNNVVAGSLILVANLLDVVVMVYLWIVVRSYDIELRRNINLPASRQKSPDVETCPMELSYSQYQIDKS